MPSEDTIRVAGLNHWFSSEGFLFGTPAACLRVGPDGQDSMTAPEIFARIRAEAMPYHIVISGALAAEPLDSMIKQGQDLGYKVSCISSGAEPVDWLSNLDALVLVPPSPSRGETVDYDSLDVTLTLAYSGERYTEVSIHLLIHDDTDYDFAKGVAELHPSVPMFLAAATDDPADAMTRFSWLGRRVIADRWNEVQVVPHLVPFLA